MPLPVGAPTERIRHSVRVLKRRRASRQDLEATLASAPRRIAYERHGDTADYALVAPTDLDATQAGYSVDAAGRSLVGEGAGDWRSTWMVIGSTTTSAILSLSI